MLQELRTNIEKQLEKQVNSKLLQEVLITLAKRHQDLKLGQVFSEQILSEIEPKIKLSPEASQFITNLEDLFDCTVVVDSYYPYYQAKSQLKPNAVSTKFSFSLDNTDFELKITEKIKSL